jgi:hypothetical protein
MSTSDYLPKNERDTKKREDGLFEYYQRMRIRAPQRRHTFWASVFIVFTHPLYQEGMGIPLNEDFFFFSFFFHQTLFPTKSSSTRRNPPLYIRARLQPFGVLPALDIRRQLLITLWRDKTAVVSVQNYLTHQGFHFPFHLCTNMTETKG